MSLGEERLPFLFGPLRFFSPILECVPHQPTEGIMAETGGKSCFSIFFAACLQRINLKTTESYGSSGRELSGPIREGADVFSKVTSLLCGNREAKGP